MSDPGKCVECEDIGCPTEGMTAICEIDNCYDIYCLGHKTRHISRKHGDCD